ncbi:MULTISPECIES: AMP-binding protein [Glaesserella]|uniref:AMP-binding protein n=1 Tax=Glaesserella australis TaxID=2094024 RepID=A0A328BX06_9PAST|nr:MULTISPECIES: AMP-binding protein [Glaesserella]AUI66519.1 AMP-binding protein [Glaesserella sp. 15-184]RAL18693.1 AMP-binding protein [Glaesserella australis]
MENLQFISQTNSFSQKLQQDNIQAVALWLEDANQFACVLLSCLNAKVRVLLPPNLLPENLQWVKENADLFITAETLSTLIDSHNLQKIEEILPLVDKQNSTEIWLKTSGSSGEAKIIKKTACQMWQEAKALSFVLPFERGTDIHLIGSVSVQHMYGLTFRIFLPLEMNWTLGNTQLQYPEYLIAESRHHRCIWVSSPALLSHLNLANEELKQSKIEGIISSGGSLPAPVGKALRQTLTCPVVEIYGSTETGVIARRLDESLWLPMPNSQIGLNEQGALWVESPWITSREQTADAVEICEQGFSLLGRIDRIVKLGDKRVSLVSIEQQLLTHHWVSDCYIALHIQQPRPLAWVALSDEGLNQLKQQGRKAIIQQLKQTLMANQEKFALPRFWRFCDKLPRNSQSKISRADFEKICLHAEDEVR